MTSSQYIHHLEKLVDEILKGRPNQTEIQTLMSSTGLSYSADPVEQMNSVLAALQECRSAKTQLKKVRAHESNV
jgi:hypothetical protein